MGIIAGTRVWDGKGKYFVVLGVFEREGKDWVYYREDKGIGASVLECSDYSCLLEAFEQKFRERS